MDKKELINNGKVKSVYTTDDENAVIIEFRDDMTAGDGARKEVMNKKVLIMHLFPLNFLKYWRKTVLKHSLLICLKLMLW